MLDKETEDHVLPTIEDLTLEVQTKLVEDIVLHKKSKTTRQRKDEIW
jgi:hypothetical protein